jgi:hypothetical protein
MLVPKMQASFGTELDTGGIPSRTSVSGALNPQAITLISLQTLLRKRGYWISCANLSPTFKKLFNPNSTFKDLFNISPLSYCTVMITYIIAAQNRRTWHYKT